MTANPEGPQRCQGPRRGLLGECWPGLHRHHVVRRSQGGADTPDNLLWLCPWHHHYVHHHPAEAKALGLLA